MRPRGLAAALVVATGALLPGGAGASTPVPVSRPAAWGPTTTTPVAGASIARDEAELARLLDDPTGPAEIALLARTYRGDLKIRRKVALRGDLGTVLEGSGTATVVDIVADDVTVENLTIRGSGQRHTTEDAGVRVKGARNHLARLFVDGTLFGVTAQECTHCELAGIRVLGGGVDEPLRGDGIKLWESHGTSVRDCFVDKARDVVVWYSRNTVLERNVIVNGRYGTHFMYAHDGVVRDSTLRDNVVGIFVMYSARLRVEGNLLAGARGAAGVGIGFKESDSVVLERNDLVANTTGVYLDRTPRTPDAPVRFVANRIALNDVGLRLHSSGAGVTMTRNDFRDNATLAEIEGGGDALGLEFSENSWSDYAGYDLDGDGWGDVPFEQKRLSGELTDAHPALRLFHGTPAMALVDVVAHALPVFAAHKLLVDPRPAMKPFGGSRP